MSQQLLSRSLRHSPCFLRFHHHHHPPPSPKLPLFHHHHHPLLLQTPSSSPQPTKTRRFTITASRGSLRRGHVPPPITTTTAQLRDRVPEEEEQEDSSLKSRNQLKREAKRAVKWGMDLASFSPPQIKRILRFLLFSSFLNPHFQKFQSLLNFVSGLLQGGFIGPK